MPPLRLSARRHAQPPGGRAEGSPGRQPVVFGESLFHDAVIRERKRADRFAHPFVLVLVDVAPAAPGEVAVTWPAVIQALTDAKRETDMLGWLQRDAALGLIMPDLAAADAAIPLDLEARMRGQIEQHLDPAALARVSVRIYGYAGKPWAGGDGPEPVDPLLQALQPPRASAARRAAKRALDIAGSTAALIVFSPVFAVVAALVKFTSPGPVFFPQERIGEGGKPFRMIKFRSMYKDNDPAVHEAYVKWFIESSGQHERQDGEVFKLTKDPRVTRVGHVIRRTSLDELPQFWNVLRGEMSLVGPRPPLPFEVENYQPWHRRRVLEAKPGITGLWQVHGRSRTTFDEMVRMDLRYAKAPSLWTDIKILAATPKAVISGKGAA